MRFSGRLIPSTLRQLCSRKHAPCPSRISSAFGSRRTRPCGSSPMIPGTSWLARLSRCAIDPTAERFSRTAQFFSRALAQLHVKGGVYIYALENVGGRRVGLLEGDRAWSSGVTHARSSCLKKRPFAGLCWDYAASHIEL